MKEQVEVVRCKNCKLRHTPDCLLAETDIGDELDYFAYIVTDDYTVDDFFCADGEE